MNNSEPIIIAKELHKQYRLYAKPYYRFLDMLGLLRQNTGLYAEHTAVNKLNLTIKAGEKVALIGRNGAGKSTLLKLISGVIMPTSGTLKVKGNARALLQIGTGFHPDFTGRENIKAYLAQLGIMGQQIQHLIDDIIDFSELEEYIDQPLKTYSTGMAARLMFATSTAIVPDLLILDEILSVGDAYFTQKSMDRISELCDAKNTTLLLVSHDTYSAAKLVDRMIWIEKGQIISDASPQITLKAYEESIRVQEEQRLRKKEFLQRASYINLEKIQHPNQDNLLMVEMASISNIPQSSLVHFSEMVLLENNQPLAILDLATEKNDEAMGLIKHACWGQPETLEGRISRPMLNYGSPHHKVAVYFRVNDLLKKIQEGALALRITYRADKPIHLVINCFSKERIVCASPLPSESQQWLTHEFPITHQETMANTTLNQSGQYGSGAINISGLKLVDDKGQSTVILEHKSTGQFIVDYEIKDPLLKEKLNIILGIFKNGVETSCRYFTEDLLFDAKNNPEGRFRIKIDEMRLGTGNYSVAIVVAKEGYFNESHLLFYTLNPKMYFCARDIFTFKVVGGNLVAQGTPYVGEANWEFTD